MLAADGERATLVMTDDWSENLEADGTLTALQETLAAETTQALSTPLTETQAALEPTENAESPLGCLIADALKEQTGADIALFPASALQAALPEGSVTGADIAALFPDSERLQLVTFTGEELKALLETALRSDFPQTAGLEGTYDLNLAPGEALLSLSLNDSALSPKALYRAALYSYALPDEAHFEDQGTLFEVLYAALEKMPAPIAPDTTPRLSAAQGEATA